jgi:hypothetical protein
MTVPALLVHVENGYPVLVSHSRAMAKAPSQHKIRNELVLIERGLALFRTLEEFLAVNLGPPP